jgi:hypothetical protein
LKNHKNKSKKKAKKKPKSDPVKNPAHYSRGDGLLECFDAFVAQYGNEAGIIAARFAIHKYNSRFDLKGQAISDLRKIQQFAEMLKPLMEDYEWPT